MRPMTTIRKWHFEQIQHSLKIVQYILLTADPQTLTTCRDHGDGWTVAEVIGHLLDCERLFLERARLTMTYDCPELPFPDQDQDVINGHYNERDPQEIFIEWAHEREDYLAYLSTVPEDGWSREGRHPRYAPLSLNDQLFLICWHDMIHADQITSILSEKMIRNEE